MTPTVALFRSPTDAAASAAGLADMGFSVVRLPVFALGAQPVRPRQARYDAVIATSANAFLGDGPIDTSSPLYVVGARAASTAKARGWRLAHPPAPDAAALIRTVRGVLKPGAGILYLAGRDRKEAIEIELDGRYALEVVEVYRAEARIAWRPEEARALQSCAAALHYSRRSAGLALELAKRADVETRFLELQHICLSRDVAAPLEAAGAGRIVVAETPDETGLFDALSHAFASLEGSRIRAKES